MVLGSGAILYGTARYVSNLRLMTKGLYRPAGLGAAVFVGGVLSVSAYAVWDVKQSDVDRAKSI